MAMSDVNLAALDQNDETDVHSRSVELVMDGRRILIADADVHAVEPIENVRIESGFGHAIGNVSHGEDVWAVFCLDAQLDFLATIPADRSICVLLRFDASSELGGVAVLCDESRDLDDASPTTVPVPGCMSGEENPVSALAIVDGAITCVVSAERLAALLRRHVSGAAVDQPAGEQ